MICPLIYALFIALIVKELYSVLCFRVLLKNSLNFSNSFVQFLFEFRFHSFLNIFMAFWRSIVHNGCSSRLVISMGNFLFRVVTGILPAVFL